MANIQAENAVNDVALSFQDALGNHLKSVYLFGSLVEGHFESAVSDINLLVIIDTNSNIDLYEEKVRPIWHNFSKTLRTNPIVASPAALNRHLVLNPLFASHLRRVPPGQSVPAPDPGCRQRGRGGRRGQHGPVV